MRISDWSSDVCSSDLLLLFLADGEVELKCMYKPNKYQLIFLKWRRRQRDNRVMPLILSALVGVTVGLAAILLKTLISKIEETAIRYFTGIQFFIIPIVGLLMVVFLNRNIFYKTDIFR